MREVARISRGPRLERAGPKQLPGVINYDA